MKKITFLVRTVLRLHDQTSELFRLRCLLLIVAMQVVELSPLVALQVVELSPLVALQVAACRATCVCWTKYDYNKADHVYTIRRTMCTL